MSNIFDDYAPCKKGSSTKKAGEEWVMKSQTMVMPVLMLCENSRNCVVCVSLGKSFKIKDGIAHSYRGQRLGCKPYLKNNVDPIFVALLH